MQFLLSAMPEVLREFPNARLVCLGEGVLRQELEQQSQTARLAGECPFCWLPQQRRPTGWRLCDFTVLPSFYEGLPLVAVESLAAGRTMVATRWTALPR